MASDYGLNFGFRRSDETVAVTEGRLKVPASGTYRLGSLVKFDSSNAGYLVAGSASDVGEGATVGLLVQEEIWDRPIYSPTRIDSFYLGVALNNRLATIVSGSGTKVWFKNTAAQTRADGRTVAAVNMVDPSNFPSAIGQYLTWDGSKFSNSSATFANSMLRVTLTNGTDYCEAVLTR